MEVVVAGFVWCSYLVNGQAPTVTIRRSDPHTFARRFIKAKRDQDVVMDCYVENLPPLTTVSQVQLNLSIWSYITLTNNSIVGYCSTCVCTGLLRKGIDDETWHNGIHWSLLEMINLWAPLLSTCWNGFQGSNFFIENLTRTDVSAELGI